jgi:outer membrane lipoprotein carrier protein
MSFFLTILLAFLQSSASAPARIPDTNALVEGVERSFARMKDLSADFVQISQDSLNRKRQESGHLYLMRSRKMRFEYKTPEDHLFVSDGKTLYSYVPADRQVNKESVRETVDDRIPLMFLLGRSNLRNEFRSFERLNSQPVVPGTHAIKMNPKRKTDFSEIVIEVEPSTFRVRRLAFTYVDGGQTEFIFSNIRTNSGLKESRFDFKVPPGVEVVEGIGSEN